MDSLTKCPAILCCITLIDDFTDLMTWKKSLILKSVLRRKMYIFSISRYSYQFHKFEDILICIYQNNLNGMLVTNVISKRPL